MSSFNEIENTLRMVVGKRCWGVYVGGITIPNFSICLGEKIKSFYIPKNPRIRKLRTENDEYDGEFGFYVVCWWRLEREGKLLVTSLDGEDEICSNMNLLCGEQIIMLDLLPPVGDLILNFSAGLRLTIFSNQPNTADERHFNWTAANPQGRITAGPGMKLKLVPKRL